jgi:hypothetical protein
MTEGFETLSFDITERVRGWAEGSILKFGFESSREAIVTRRPSRPAGLDHFAAGPFASSANADFVPAARLLLAGIGGLGPLRGYASRAA